MIYGRRVKTYCQTPDGNATQEAIAGSQRQRLEDIRATADTTINSDWDSSTSNRCAYPEGIECRRHAVKLATTVVGNDHSVNAMPDSQFHIFGRTHYEMKIC
jgi:hypothetical protein